MTQYAPTQPLKAALCILGAMAMLGCIDNFVYRISEEIGLWQMHFVRSIMALTLIGALSALGFGTLRPKRLGTVVIRSALVATSMLLYFGSLAFLPIAQSLAGLFTSPIWVLVISAIALKIPVGPVRVVAVAFGFAGTLMVLQPDPANLSPVTLMPVAAGLLYALGALATRRWCLEETTLCLLAGFMGILGLWGLIGLGTLTMFPQTVPDGPDGFLIRGWVPISPIIWGLIIMQAIGSVIGVGLIIKAYQLGETSYVAVFEYAVILFASFFAYIFFGQLLNPLAVLGVVLVIAGGSLIALRSRPAVASVP